MITVATLRTAIARCVAQASQDAPTDADMRTASFVARLSGSMESLGDHELDAMIWGLLDMPPGAPRVESIMQTPILGIA